MMRRVLLAMVLWAGVCVAAESGPRVDVIFWFDTEDYLLPADDDHRCEVRRAEWRERPGGLVFQIEANRFLHHMVRFLVGTMIDVALGRRPASDVETLLAASDNANVSPPAPAHALFLDRVSYPAELYLHET